MRISSHPALDPQDHLGLAYKVVNRHLRRHPESRDYRDDLQAEAALALTEACRLFDPERGFQPSTYLFRYVDLQLRKRVKLRSVIRPSYRDGARKCLTVVSLDAPANIGADDESSGTLADILPDEHALGPAELDDQLTDRQRVAAILEGLNERERLIVRQRFGIGTADKEPRTLAAIGAVLGLTRERVRQIQARAFGTMRIAAAQLSTA